ncbi:lysophospholipid acyltransferase family protein [candidate division KSB1 bacterium]|nr:lysophospholipid acyltransferase family protein [candidate division KSB1 bacterium]
MKNLKRTIKRAKNWFIYIATKALVRLLNSVRRTTAFNILKSLGILAYYVLPDERNKTKRHLKKVFVDENDRAINRMAKDVFIYIGCNVVDAFRIAKFTPENIDDYVTAHGLQKLDAAQAKGKGVLLVTGHIGNWELLGAYLAIKGYPLYVIGAPLYDPRMDQILVKNRENSGLKYIPRGDSTRLILKALKNREMIGILIDQDSRHVSGEFVDFLGHEAYTPVGPAVLAMKTGAPLVPLAIHLRSDYHHVIEIGDVIELESSDDEKADRIQNTLKCSKAVETFIRKHPKQWVWMHRRWKTKRKKIAKT